MIITTDRLQSPVFDCCLIIRWCADHPERRLPDLPRSHAERLLEDMVTTLQPHVRELLVVEQLPSGEQGLVLRSWSQAVSPSPDDAPPHSPTWSEAAARVTHPPTHNERTTA
jgi:hypothetical protein